MSECSKKRLKKGENNQNKNDKEKENENEKNYKEKEKLADCYRTLAYIYIRNDNYIKARKKLIKWCKQGIECGLKKKFFILNTIIT